MTDISNEFRALIAAAERVSADVGDVVRDILQAGLDQPLEPEEARQLLGRILTKIREQADVREDRVVTAQFATDLETLIDRIESARVALRQQAVRLAPRVELVDHNGIAPRPVLPTPVFHERSVAVREGFVRTRDIQLWGENQRIDIHLNQFQQAHGRQPNAEELLSIMLGKMSLPGVTEDDQFEISELARSVATNGVRKPPIIDREGNLLDGNRRVTACYYILNSSDFDADQKKRAEWLQVWQLTEHATDEDREAVIVSLNFEPDYKQDWPEYVKARKVYAFWQGLLSLEGRANPSPARQTELRRTIARRFAIKTDRVTRYINMVELTDEFEDYHVVERGKDKFAVKHKAEKYFQYFEELGKGRRNGILQTLNDDEGFKSLVYDLLYDDKFKNWAQIRELKSVYNDDDAMLYLREAADLKGKEAQVKVETAIAMAKASREIERKVGANKRVEIFVNWLENAPVKIFRPGPPDALTHENLTRLYQALKLVESYVEPSDEAGNAG
jgi:hypothetical protein